MLLINCSLFDLDASGQAIVFSLPDSAFSSQDTNRDYIAHDVRFDNEFGWVAAAYTGNEFVQVGTFLFL